MSGYAGLAARIQRALLDLDRLLPRVQLLIDRARRDDDFAVIDSLALNLQALYTGLEQIFQGIAREVDGGEPTGPNWHQDLLTQMAGEVTGGRPAVISSTSYTCLDKIRGFRHVVRNVYAYNLDAERVVQLATEILGCYDGVRHELQALSTVLASPD